MAVTRAAVHLKVWFNLKEISVRVHGAPIEEQSLREWEILRHLGVSSKQTLQGSLQTEFNKSMEPECWDSIEN